MKARGCSPGRVAASRLCGADTRGDDGGFTASLPAAPVPFVARAGILRAVR